MKLNRICAVLRAVLLRFVFSLSFVFLLNAHMSLAMAIEEPKFETLKKEDPFEVRRYAPYLVAETFVQAGMDGASNQGFRRIADFIFGNNQTPAGGSVGADTGIVAGAVTGGVTGSSNKPPEKVSSKIAMTAPVVVEPLQDIDQPMLNSEQWRVFFVMPSEYSEATLPKPNNPDVKIRSVPTKYYAVFNYSGFNGTGKIQEYSDQLMQWVVKNHLKALGAPKLARYNPPWTLPMFRRNEILIEIEDFK